MGGFERLPHHLRVAGAIEGIVRTAVGQTDDLGHDVGAEALDDLVERPRHGRQRGQLFDQRVAPAGSLATFDRLAIPHHGP